MRPVSRRSTKTGPSYNWGSNAAVAGGCRHRGRGCQGQRVRYITESCATVGILSPSENGERGPGAVKRAAQPQERSLCGRQGFKPQPIPDRHCLPTGGPGKDRLALDAARSLGNYYRRAGGPSVGLCLWSSYGTTVAGYCPSKTSNPGPCSAWLRLCPALTSTSR
jgi:hypothetical protein